jgi:diguanylate cyclase (GGDEF)-like protein/PAS domain S-box-containing protein
MDAIRSQAEANLAALIESTDDLIWSVDLDYRKVVFNNALRENLEKNFGVRIQAGTRAEDDLPPERAALWTPLYDRALREGPFRTEYSLVDGRTLELAFNPIVVDGKATGISVFGKDITERKQVEAALAGSEDLFRAITDSSPLAMVLLSGPEERIQYINPTFTRLFGYTMEEIPTIAEWWPLAYPDAEYSLWVKEEWQRKVTRTFETNSPFEPIEVEVTCKDGSKKIVKWGFLMIGGRSLAYGLDRTAYKQAEARLRDSEESSRATFEQAAVGFVQASFEGRILRGNAQFARMIGYSQEELSTLTVEEVTTPEARPETAAVLRRIRNEEAASASFEKRFLRKDGSFVWARVTASLQRDGAGIPLHFFAVVEDIQERKESEERLAATTESLRASEARYRTAFQTNLDAVDICRLEDGKFIDVNDAFVNCTGFTREEAIGHTALELGLWANPSDRQRLVAAISEDSVCRNLEAPYRTKDGGLRWGLLSVSAIELDGVACILSITKDITEAKAAEERLATIQESLRHSEARYRNAFQTSPDAVNIARIGDGRIIDANQTFFETTGYEYEEVIGNTTLGLNLWVHPPDREELMQELRRQAAIRDKECQFRRKDGTIFWARITVSLIEIDGEPCLISFARDISAVKAAEEEIRNLSFFDPLTGLPNRRRLMDRLRQSLAASAQYRHRHALLLIDLDDFKTTNDTLGHQTGDLLLQESARRLCDCIRPDDVAARLGGDEFVVILEDLSAVPEEAASQAKDVAEKIIEAFAQPYLLAGRDCRSSACIGIAIFGVQEKEPEEVLQQADIALGQAKAAARNTTRFYAPALQAAVNARATMEEDLREAIGTYELKLYYQPQRMGPHMLGVEALLRWKHPLRGNIPPSAFIPLAEETGLILPLGNWVLEAACHQIAAWERHPQGSKVPVSVNISARQLHQPDFVEQVLTALDRTGADPRRLKLELTESMLVENVEEVIAKMTRLKAYGLSFSLDDFGTGYSSLSYLKRLPLNELKIDLSFVRDLLVDSSSGAIVETILALSRAMGLSTIAEGVETEAQRAFLARLGCHAYQGYLFSPALPVEEFERLFLGAPVEAVPLFS